MRRRPVARVTTGVAVATVALTSVLAGTAWAPKILLVPPDLTRQECLHDGWQSLKFDSFQRCMAEANLAMKEAKEASKALQDGSGR